MGALSSEEILIFFHLVELPALLTFVSALQLFDGMVILLKDKQNSKVFSSIVVMHRHLCSIRRFGDFFGKFPKKLLKRRVFCDMI